jgi:hypothetical protein
MLLDALHIIRAEAKAGWVAQKKQIAVLLGVTK